MYINVILKYALITCSMPDEDGKSTPAVPTALLDVMTNMLTNALKASITGATAAANDETAASNEQHHGRKPPPFSIKELRSSDDITVEDYFKRFDWALDQSKVSETQHANYARVHMGIE